MKILLCTMAGYVKRTPDKGQKVTYSLNLEKIGKAKEYSERVKRVSESQRENMKEFFSMSERQQVDQEALLLAKFLRNEMKVWLPRIPTISSSFNV